MRYSIPILMHEATEIVINNQDWMTYVYLIIFSSLVVVRLLFDRRLYENTTLFFSRKYLAIYFNREKRNSLTLFQTILVIPQILVIALFLTYVGNYLYPETLKLSFDSFFKILIGVSLYFGLRFVLGILISLILNLRKAHNRILYEKTSYFNNIILWILPFLILTSYAPYNHEFNLKFTSVLFLILVFMRYGLLILNNKKLIVSNLFYFILYLCTLEIAPLIIISKTTI